MPTENTGLPAVCAVIVAAGSSRRMGGENKLLMPLCGRPVLAHTLEAFERSRAVRDIVLVCREQDMETYRALAESSRITKLRTMVQGGATRTDSVLAGVSASPEDAALVAVHDGARPLVSDKVITDAVRAATESGAAAPVVPVKDSIKRIENGKIAADVPRDRRRRYSAGNCCSTRCKAPPRAGAALRTTARQWKRSDRRSARPKAAMKTSRSQRLRTFSLPRRLCTGRQQNEYANRTWL